MQRNALTLFAVLFSMIFLAGFVTADTAICLSKFENIAIITAEAYSIGEPIAGINISVTGNIPLNLPYRAQLFRGSLDGPVLADIRDARMSEGHAILDFDYVPLAPEDLVILLESCANPGLEVRDCPDTDLVTETKEIVVRKTFDLNLYCPITNYVGDTVICTWEPTDLETNLIIPIGTPIATVSQGENILSSPISGTSLSFQPNILGSVTVKLEAFAEGYIDRTEEITVQVQVAGVQQIFEIDGRDFFTLGDAGITVGTRQLTFTVKEGNAMADLQEIDAEMVTPSGQVSSLVFNKAGDEWRSTYNFQQPGSKYIFRGSIKFSDIDKPTIPFNYDILTLGSQTEKDRSIVTSIIIWVSAGLMVFVVIIVVVLMRRGKRKKKK